MTGAYSPSRGLPAKLRRALVQARATRPAELQFGRGALSISFDDFPHSSAALGAPVLERHGVRGTFYAAAGLTDQEGPQGRNHSREDISRLARAGHEIGCHTFAHHDCARRGAYESLIDLARNRDALAQMGAPELRTLAYPFGETSVELKATLPARFLCARGVNAGLNVGRVDLAHLRSYPLFGRGIAAAHKALARAARRGAWIIVFTHDVAETPSPWGVSPRALDDFIAAARQLRLDIAPLAQVATRVLA